MFCTQSETLFLSLSYFDSLNPGTVIQFAVVYVNRACRKMFSLLGQIFDKFYDSFAIIGFVAFLIFAFNIFVANGKIFYAYVIGGLTLQKRLKGYGQWAIVTGATRGCGLEYSKQLAQLGLNLVLVARNENLLKKLATDLESKYKIKTAICICHFDHPIKESFDNFAKALNGKDIGILLNNAGMMYDHPELFHRVPKEILIDLINVNIVWTQMMAHYVLDRFMLSKKKGLIVFMSSLVDEAQTPMISAYGASKAYITYLVKCLSVEYASSGVKFQLLSPSYIASDMTKYHEKLNTPSLLSPSVETYVSSAIRTFGTGLRLSGYYPHDVMREVVAYVPQCLYRYGAFKWQEYINKTKRT